MVRFILLVCFFGNCCFGETLKVLDEQVTEEKPIQSKSENVPLAKEKAPVASEKNASEEIPLVKEEATDKEMSDQSITFRKKPSPIPEKNVALRKIIFTKTDKCLPSLGNKGSMRGLNKIANSHIGETITTELLDQLHAEITENYRDNGYPVVGVSFPEQDISDGILKVSIMIAYLGKVQGEGARWFSNEKLARQVKAKPGETIRTSRLMTDVEWLNNNPFRKVDLIYEKGDRLGETNIVVHTSDTFPLRIVSGYENNGYIIAGDSRTFVGFNWGNVFGLDHQLNYQFITANSVRRWYGNVASYIAPLPWRHTFQAFGTFVKTEPDLSSSDININKTKGKGWQLGGRYSIPLPSIVHISHFIEFGYDFKRTNNFLEFGDVFSQGNYFDISQFVFQYNINWEGDYLNLTAAATGYFSPGGMTHFNHDRDFSQERPGAKSNYVYGIATLDWIYRLPKYFSWVFSSKFQWSTGKLLPTEEMIFGGYLSIRGYDEGEIIADRGVLFRNEARTNPISLFPWWKRKLQDEFQLLMFLDVGYAIDINQNIFSKNSKVLASLGPGFRYHIRDYLSVRCDYGVQVQRVKGRPFVSTDRAQFHAGVILSF